LTKRLERNQTFEKELFVSIYDYSLHTLTGEELDLSEFKGKVTLMVNVASKCGLTPQYEGLEDLQKRYAGQGFTVLGFPCNQFGGQEPGTADEIAEFCSATYGVSFPLTEKVDVNGQQQAPIYRELTAVADADGQAGEIQWNFEKFLISPEGEVVQRFRPSVTPESDTVVKAIESVLPN